MWEEKILIPVWIENVELSSIDKQMKVSDQYSLDQFSIRNGQCWYQWVEDSINSAVSFEMVKLEFDRSSSESTPKIAEGEDRSWAGNILFRPVRILLRDIAEEVEDNRIRSVSRRRVEEENLQVEKSDNRREIEKNGKKAHFWWFPRSQMMEKNVCFAAQ